MKRPPFVIAGLDVPAEVLRQELADANAIFGPRTPGVGENPALATKYAPFPTPFSRLYRALAEALERGEKTVILADGDPLFFGVAREIVARFGTENVRVIPALCCLQKAAARARIPWGNFVSFSLHGRVGALPPAAPFYQGRPVCVLTDRLRTPAAVAGFLLDRGVENYVAMIFEKLATPEERIRSMDLQTCSRTVFQTPNLLFLLPLPDAGKARPLAPKGKYSTKLPIRATAINLLSVNPGEVVWDVGAGSGAVALEMARAAFDGRVYAIERDPERALDVQQNRKTAGVPNLQVVFGEAPAIFKNTPKPDRVFVGGGLSGKDGRKLALACAEALAPGGRIVAACALLESLDLFADVLKELEWKREIWQVYAARSEPLGGGERLKPQAPIFLVAAGKPG